MDDAGFGHGQQEQVQFVHGCGEPGQPAVTYPGVVRGGPDLGVLALVVVRDETSDGRVQLFEGQYRRRRRVAAGQVSGESGQQLRINGAEEPFDLSPPMGPGNR